MSSKAAEENTVHDEAEEEHDSEEGEEQEDTGPSPKRAKKAPQASNGGPSLGKELQQLQKQKNIAVKSENYAEAMRLKPEIDALKAKIVNTKKEAAEAQSAAKAKTAEDKAAAQAAKRKAPESVGDSAGADKKAAKKPAKEEPKPPPVEELAADPFFDVKTAALLAPNCLTAQEREAWRAVHTGNLDFLSNKLVDADVPLFCPRDIVSKQTALHLAIEIGSSKAMNTLARLLQSARHQGGDTPRKRASTMAAQSTGTMNVLTLGFETGKIGAARGGRELNNALVDSNEKGEGLYEVVGRGKLSRDQLKLLMNVGIVTLRAVVRRNKLIIRGRDGPHNCDLTQCLDPAMRNGRLEVVREILEQTEALGVGVAHKAAVSKDPFPEKMQGRSVAAKIRYGGQMTPVHIAAINPDASKLAALLKLEPSALTILTDQGHHAVHFSAACEGPGPLKLLLSEWNVERALVGPDKRTPLHFAARAGCAENIRTLMGGGGIGPGASISFAKAIRAVLMRQKPANVKIGNDGACVLSRLLVDLMHRIVADATARLQENPALGLKAIHRATREVLKGKLASRIAQKSGKLTAGKGGLTRAGSELVQTLNDASEEVLRIMFNSIDTNSDGKLDRKEIEVIFDSAKMKLSKKAFANVVKAMDLDGNGDVSLEEFTAWMEAKSAHAVSLRRHLLVNTGTMEQGELAQAEDAEEKELLEGVETLAFDSKPLLQVLTYAGNDSDEALEQNVAYTSAVLECACTKVLEVSANAARSQKKPTISPDHIMNSIKLNEELQGLVQKDSVVMNALLLPMKDREGYSALHAAAEAGHTQAVEMLIACGADADVAGPDRKTPLALAAERGRVGCVKVLLAAGAKLEVADKRKRTPLLLAVRAGQTVVASILLHNYANPNTSDDSGNTIVHYAAAFGWVDCVSLLHKAGAELSVANAMKLAPITAALQKGHKTVFRRMLDLGIDVNFRDADGSTLLLGCLGTANRFVHEEILFMMSKGADPALASSLGMTPLHALAQASVQGTQTTASFFVAHPFEAERLQRVAGWSPRPNPPRKLGMDEDEEDEDEDEDEDENVENGQSQPPAKKQKVALAQEEVLDEKVYRRGFHQLTTQEREAVFRLGWQQQTWQAGDNPTAAWASLNPQQQDAAKVLGLEESTWPVMPVRLVQGIRSSDGQLPLKACHVLGASDDGVVRLKLDGQQQVVAHISMILLAEEEAEKVWSETPHVTVAIARVLLEGKAQIDARDSNGATPLMLALRTGKLDLALMLLDAGADPNAKETPKVVPAVAAAGAAEAAAAEGSGPVPRPRSVLTDASTGGFGDLSRGVHALPAVLKKLLLKGCTVDEPATAVDQSPMLKFISASDLESATLLLEAKADPSADSQGSNALHKISSEVFKQGQDAAKTKTAVDFAMKLLSSPQWGTRLLAEFTRTPPHVTPLHSMVQAYTSGGQPSAGAGHNFGGFGGGGGLFGGGADQGRNRQMQRRQMQQMQQMAHFGSGQAQGALAHNSATSRSQILLQLLEAAPESVDFSKWTKPAAAAVQCQPPQSPLSLLCVQEFFQVCPELGVKAVTLLCKRGISPNASHGSPAALHSLAQRLHGTIATSSLAKVLLPLTDLNALMPDSRTLLTFLLNPDSVLSRQFNQPERDSVKMLLEGLCDPNLTGKGPPPLHIVSQFRDEGLIRDLVAARADPNLPNKNAQQRCPLHYAVANAPTGADANFDAEEVLLKARADPTACDALGFTALHYAFMKASSNALAFDGSWLEVKTPPGGGASLRTWNQKAWPLIGDRVDPVETISSLCVLPGIKVNAKDNSGMSPLHLAALRGASISALKLISAGAQLEEEFCGNTPLGLAMHAHPDMAVLLMQRSANTKASCVLFGAPGGNRAPISGLAESIFSLAVRQVSHNPGGGATYLGAAISSLDCGFPIAQALNDTIASQQHIMLLTLIPKVNPEVLRSQRFECGHNLLHRVAAGGRGGSGNAFIRAAGKLLERGVLVAPDEGGETPLHLAALQKYEDLVNLLLEQEAVDQSIVSAKDKNGRTALGCALADSGDFSVKLKIAKALIAKGASASQALVEPKWQIGALSYCIAHDQPPAIRGQSCWPQALFVKEPPDVIAYTSQKDSCLSFAAKSKTHGLSYLQLIVSWATADQLRQLMLARREDGRTALMFAVVQGNVDFVDAYLREAHNISRELLQDVLSAKLSDGTSEWSGTTALMQAMGSTDAVGMVWTILRWMDDKAIAEVLPSTDSSGRTALMLAVLLNSTPIVRMLLQGNPLQPRPTTTTCPGGKMAGDKAFAWTVYAGSAGGAPNFNLSWMSAPARFANLPVQAQAQQGDGCASVPLYADRAGKPSSLLAGGTHAQVTSIEGEWAKADAGWVKLRDLAMPGEAGTPAAPNGKAVHLVMPPGTGPGVSFDITWDATAGGPGQPGLAGSFAGAAGGPSRVPASILNIQDKEGRSALHHCVCPLPFGSFENSEMAALLIQAKVSPDLREGSGQTALDFAAKQRSGKMLQCFRELALAVPAAQAMDVDDASPWPAAVDAEADAASAVKAAEAAKEKADGKPEPPIEKHFQRPSANSRVVVANGPDGGPLDLVMTKVDLQRGPCPQNVFYRMQVLHEKNQDNYFLFTRWGRIGDRGQFQASPFESLEKATAEFLKIFKSKAGNEWSDRSNFEKKNLKYQLHDLKYNPTVAAEDVLSMGKWTWLPAKATPMKFRRILNVGSSLEILSNALHQANVDQPLGMLQKKPLDDARALLGKIRGLVRQRDEESRKSEPSGDRMQAILDEISSASSRIYELAPTRNFQHANVGPIDNIREVKQCLARLEVTDDITCAARLLLGAQAQVKKMSPTDYLYSALGIYAEPLKDDSHELHLIERYINKSSPGTCRLFSGEGAVALPERPDRELTPAEIEAFLPQWQVLQEVTCFDGADCTKKQHAGLVAVAGGTLKEYARERDAICIRKASTNPNIDPLWVRPIGADGTNFMIQLSRREANSNIAAVYSAGRKEETTRGGGETASLLFHGSGMPNCLSIFSQGLRVKPPGAMHHGSAFGNGIYFANAYQKSRNYCSLDRGVGFMLLCEVTTGKTLQSQGFNFPQAVRGALIAAARERLGLPVEAPINENPELKAAVREIDQEMQLGEVEDLTGTGYDSFHMVSGCAPQPAGDVVHPDGYRVPCGQISSRTGGEVSPSEAKDEIIVYDTSRVRVRYVLELRDGSAAELKTVKKPAEAADGAPVAALLLPQENEEEHAEEPEEDEEQDEDEDEDEDEDDEEE